MKQTKHVKYWLWYNVARKALSLGANAAYWAGNLGSIKASRREKRRLLQDTLTVGRVAEYMAKFTWVEDKFTDWRPWVITVLHSGLRDDCDGAAILGACLLEEIGYSPKIYHLKGDNGGHAVAVAEDVMVSNDEVYKLHGDIIEEIDGIFDGKYSYYYIEK